MKTEVITTLEVGDRVAVINRGSAFNGRIGTVVDTLSGSLLSVDVEPATRFGREVPAARSVAFYPSELTAIQD